MKLKLHEQPRHIQHLLIAKGNKGELELRNKLKTDQSDTGQRDSLLDTIMSGLAWNG